jgi:hypothetical protein
MKEVTETVVNGDDESSHLKDPQPSRTLGGEGSTSSQRDGY